MPEAQVRDMLTVAEVADRLGVAVATAYRAAGRNEFPVLRVGRRLLIPRLAFQRWLETGCLLEGQRGSVPGRK